MFKIEARKLDENIRPLRPPKWGSQTTEEQEASGTQPSGKTFSFLFSRTKMQSYGSLSYHERGARPKYWKVRGLVHGTPTAHSVSATTISMLEFMVFYITQTCKTFTNNVPLLGLKRENLKSETLKEYNLRRCPPKCLAFSGGAITPAVYQSEMSNLRRLNHSVAWCLCEEKEGSPQNISHHHS